VASQANPLARFLPTRLRQDADSVSSDVMAAHHSSITWYLSRRLTEASQSQKEMQEERVKRQAERTRTLGSTAAREMVEVAFNVSSHSTEQGEKKRVGWLGSPSNFIAATIGAPSVHGKTGSPVSVAKPGPPPEDDVDEDIELSESQIMQFEMENADLLRSVHDTLESVQLAESRLVEISALQMELVTHLTRQTELTDQLYDDAIATTSTVEKGNAQLQEARRRAKDSRKWILLFLVGASLSLLFIHYY
jgi:syntaxin 18